VTRPERYLLFKLAEGGVCESLLSVELAVGLAHLTGRVLVFDTPTETAESGVAAFLDFFGGLPVATETHANLRTRIAQRPKTTRELDLNLAGAAFVTRAAAADPAALADFAGSRTLLSDPEEDILRLRGINTAYYSRIFHAPPMSVYAVMERLAPRQPYAALAAEVAKSLGRFNSAHVVVGDFRKLLPYRGLDYSREILNNLAKSLNADELLVIATDEPENAEFFAPIVAHFRNHVFVEPLIAGDFGRTLGALPSVGKQAMEWVSQLVLRHAEEFVGTPGSAFSGLAQRHIAMAQAKRDLFSEPRPFRFTYAGAATIDVPFEDGMYLETKPGRYSWNRLGWAMEEETKSWYREWPEATPPRTHEAPRPAGRPAPEARPMTLVTSFKGPGVPPQLTGEPQVAPGRPAIQQQMQAIACDLMFGADRSDLIRRIVALGAPPVEAKRIIDQAYDDPLIANGRAMASVLRRRDWLLDAMERQQRLWPPAAAIERREALSADEFLDRFYSRGRPVILTGAMASWNAMTRWTPAALAAMAGEIEVVCHSADRRRAGVPNDARRLPFARFLEIASRPGERDAPYLLADEHMHNPALAKRLAMDHGALDALLDTGAAQAHGTLWIGPSRVLTPLHHDLVNSLVAQVAGRNRFKIVAAGEVAKLHNHLHVLSEIEDLEAPGIAAARFPGLANVQIHDVTLAPGEILYLPLAWWYQVRSDGFGISVTYTNFRWPNNFFRSYPAR
jgi:hypothetical protein